MRIFYHELRKIWRLTHVLPIAALGVLIFFGFLYGSLFDGFLEMHPVRDRYDLAFQWTAQYGAYLDASEYEAAQAECAALREQVDAQIAADPALAAYGIVDMAALKQALSSQLAPETAVNNFLQSGGDELYYYVETVEWALAEYVNVYEHYTECADAPGLTPAERARYREVVGQRRLDGIFSGLDNILSNYQMWCNLFAVLSVTLLLAPCGAQERLCHMPAEQWTTRTGRKVVRYRLAAALASAAILFVMETLIFGSIYTLAVGTRALWNNPVTSFLMGDILWFDLTYGGYALAGFAMTFALMLAAAGATFALSHGSDHFIAALLKAGIPAFLCAASGMLVGYRLFTTDNPLYQQFRVMGSEAILCAALCAAGLLASLLPLFTDRRKELL